MTAKILSLGGQICVVAGSLLLGASTEAARIVQVDTDGSNSGTALTLNPRVTFGNGMTGGYTVSIHASAAGLANGNSIAGGNAPVKDQYIFSYIPGTDADNYSPAPGTALGNGNTASGLPGGDSGMYNVYACWPNTSNISDAGATPTNYIATSDTTNAVADLNQDERSNGALVGGVWALIGTVDITAGNTYTVTQTAPNTLFVSMRAEAVMWEAIPEPTSAMMSLFGGALLVSGRRIRRRTLMS